MANAAVTSTDMLLRRDTVRACILCGKALRRGHGGSARRFCSARCRTEFWSACRTLGERAIARGVVTIADLKADPAACTLAGRAKAPPPRPETGSPDQASPAPLRRFLIQVP